MSKETRSYIEVKKMKKDFLWSIPLILAGVMIIILGMRLIDLDMNSGYNINAYSYCYKLALSGGITYGDANGATHNLQDCYSHFQNPEINFNFFFWIIVCFLIGISLSTIGLMVLVEYVGDTETIQIEVKKEEVKQHE